MKVVTVLTVAFVGLIQSQPQHPAQAYIVRYVSDNLGFGGYSYSVATSNNIQLDESGYINNQGTKNEALTVRGSFSYIAPNGITYTVNYIADENGFQPEGDHIPPSAGVRKLGAPKPIPTGVLASLTGGT